ncbi:FAD/NAD-P-binding domain-containing protein [Roridomyces roridus]|uniref:FAD/NAD-P-binding domain-containing protein n=1 Tax=Roridomyces roridus TaxID=1738132 RepID=A0AAD7BAW9_9AGAR|nr:FAD/NAD-P-binding domain-containing protein [Roridomyces roridus]
MHHEIAVSWLSKFSTSLSSRDARATAECIQPTGFLRDVLVFTWRNRTLSGTDRISAYLADAFDRGVDLSGFTLDLDCPGFEPRVGHTSATSFPEAVSAGFVFRTSVGVGRGYFSLVPAESPRGSWKAVNVFMILWDICGHEEMGEEEGTYAGHTIAWEDVDSERRAKVEKDPHVLIIGAGQTGLNIAARFRQMQIPTLLIEKNPRVGDSWRQRYPTLTLHSPKSHTSMLYHPYPENWPTFTSRDKLANWLEQYAISQDLCIWTNTQAIPTPTYDPSSCRWTITVIRDGISITLHPIHIVLAAGIIGTPRIPHFTRKSSFHGPILHSWEYRGGKPFAGHRVVVVGAANSAADICQDLVVQGAREVTMVQRSSSCVVSRSSIRAVVDRIWPPGVPISTADFKYMATPFKLIKRVLSERKDELREHEKELHDVLSRAGLQLNMGEDGSGQFPMFFERYGGYWLEVGCAAFIESGQVRIKHGVEVASVEEQAVNFTDGSSLEADAIIFSTGYESIRDTMRGLLGDEVIDQTEPVWGVDEEGEIRGCYHYSGHPGLWFAGGNFVTSRFYSKQLALQIKAIELGLMKL